MAGKMILKLASILLVASAVVQGDVGQRALGVRMLRRAGASTRAMIAYPFGTFTDDATFKTFLALWVPAIGKVDKAKVDYIFGSTTLPDTDLDIAYATFEAKAATVKALASLLAAYPEIEAKANSGKERND